MNVCIIPARGGSKRIPRKNIKNFCGQPIISWSIQTALKCKFFNRVIVSTDDNEIAEAEVLRRFMKSKQSDLLPRSPLDKNKYVLLLVTSLCFIV